MRANGADDTGCLRLYSHDHAVACNGTSGAGTSGAHGNTD